MTDVRKLVAEMLARPGLYVCGDSNHPTKLVPLWVDRGQAHSMELDSPLAPDRFLPTFVIYSGPHVAPAFSRAALATAPAGQINDARVAQPGRAPDGEGRRFESGRAASPNAAPAGEPSMGSIRQLRAELARLEDSLANPVEEGREWNERRARLARMVLVVQSAIRDYEAM